MWTKRKQKRCVAILAIIAGTFYLHLARRMQMWPSNLWHVMTEWGTRCMVRYRRVICGSKKGVCLSWGFVHCMALVMCNPLDLPFLWFSYCNVSVISHTETLASFQSLLDVSVISHTETSASFRTLGRQRHFRVSQTSASFHTLRRQRYFRISQTSASFQNLSDVNVISNSHRRQQHFTHTLSSHSHTILSQTVLSQAACRPVRCETIMGGWSLADMFRQPT